MHRLIVAHMLTGEAADTINTLRERFDHLTHTRIRAHLTLAGPFDSPQLTQSVISAVAEITRRVPPTPLVLCGFASFLPASYTTFACVNDADRIIALHDRLLEKLGWTEQYVYLPHVTITEYLDEAKTRYVSELLGQTPLLARDLVGALRLLRKDATGVWQCIESFPLEG